MSRFKSKELLLNDVLKERAKLDGLLDRIPQNRKEEEVVDGMSVKDFLAHRTEWGRMFLGWYKAVHQGEIPAVPHQQYKWNQLKPLNAEIFERFKDVPLEEIEKDFVHIHAEILNILKQSSEKELFAPFIGNSDLAAYINSATAAHYRSAYKHINKWWRVQQHK